MTQPTPEQHPDFAFGPDGTPWSELLRYAGLSNGGPSLITEPSAAPQTVYPCDPEVRAEDFQIPMGGLSAKQRKRALNGLETYLVEKREHMVGFQGNQDMGHYQQDLGRFLEFHLNNVGDPFQEGNYKLNTKLVERAVLDHYAALWRANWPHNTGRPSPEDYWGYVLTMGSTEGNLYALYNARDYLSGKKLITRPTGGGDGGGGGGGQMMYVQTAPRAREADSAPGNRLRPVVLYSEDTHYSIVKAVRTLAIDTFGAVGRSEYPGECPLDGDWPMEVPSRGGADGSGEIDVAALVTLVEFFARRQHPILLLLNFGTTFKGACDNVGKIAGRLYPVLRDNGLLERTFEFEPGRPETRRGFWIHVDGALGAGYVPFLRIAAEREDELGKAVRREIRGGIPEFDFGLRVEGVDMVSSIVMSGHKWPGAPWPCGVFMTKNKFRVEPPSVPAYTGSPDTTFAGSRNGLSPLVLWDHLAQKSVEEHAATAVRALRLTRYLETQLRELEDLLDREDRLPEEGLYVNRSPMALTVRFRQPEARIVDKWSLSCQPMLMNSGQLRHYAHIFVMPSVTEEKIDAFVEDLMAPGAFDGPVPVEVPVQLAAAMALADDVHALALVPTIGRGFQ